MDHGLALVQSYLQLNGYFTSAESPIISSTGRHGFRTITDIDVLAFRFPSGLDAPKPVPVRTRTPREIDRSELDPGLGTAPDMIDMIIGEVKEGRVGINSSARDPEVLKAVIGRLGQTGEEDQAVADLLHTGVARVGTGVMIRFIAFGAFPPGAPVPPCRIISLGHVVGYLQNYVRKHYSMLRHLQLKDPAFGFVLAMEKAKRGAAGRRGAEGVEIVSHERAPRKVPGSDQPASSRKRR
jgi:hypothetical protein